MLSQNMVAEVACQATILEADALANLGPVDSMKSLQGSGQLQGNDYSNLYQFIAIYNNLYQFISIYT